MAAFPGIAVEADDETSYLFRTDGVTILYENLKSEYYKVHRKIPDQTLGYRSSSMRLKDGDVKISIEVNIESSPDCTFVTNVAVQRERAAWEEVRQMNDGGKKYVRREVNIDFQAAKMSETRRVLSIDLDSVYTAQEDGILKHVYALCPSNIEVTNKFQLVTEVFARRTDEASHEVDQLLAKKESKPFLLRTTPRGLWLMSKNPR